MKIIYYANSVSSAFNSQVVELLQYLGGKLHEVYLIISLNEDITLEIPGVTVYKYRHVPEFPGSSFYHARKLKGIFKRIGLDSSTVIHTRGHLSAAFALKALGNNHLNVKVLPDFRGAIIEEIRDYYAMNSFLKKMKISIFKNAFHTIRRLPGVSVVSPALGTYVTKWKGPSKYTFVNTCIAGENFIYDATQRSMYREKMGLQPNDILLVFSSGGNSKWQQSDFILNALKKLPVKILLLGTEGASDGQVLRLRVPYNEVAGYLCAADIGVLYRENDTVNKVAAPIKFSEYMSCGLPVITNDAIDYVVEIMSKIAYGYIINDFNVIEMDKIYSLLKLNREDICVAATRIFGIEQIGQQYIQCYKTLIIDSDWPDIH